MSYQGLGYPAGYEDEDQEEALETMEIFTQSLKITVVPNITEAAGLNGEDFEAQLPAEQENWFQSYQSMWNSYKSTPFMSQSLETFLMTDDNPLLLALKLFAHCPGCNNLKNKNLALFVLETICALQKKKPEIADMCTDNMRMVAFNFIKTSGVVHLYKGMTVAYQLAKIKDILITKIEELIDQKQYKDAATWAKYLEVTQSFDIYQIVLPLILQNKTSFAIDCLDMSVEQQKEIVQFLDSLLDKQKTVIEHCFTLIEQYGYNDLNHSIISFRPMSKLVARLAKKYQIEGQLTPNLSYTKIRSYMNYLYKRFRDCQMSRDSFRELVKDAATTTALKYDLVANISSHGDREEALYWVRLYNIPSDQWPPTLCDDGIEYNSYSDTVDGWVGEDSPSNNSGDASPSGNTDNYLQLELRNECIIFVDCRALFLEMIHALETESLIGFDSEWKPSAFETEIVSLLQLATFKKVFLIDVTSEEITDDLWKLLGRNIFNNLEILKIGFALRQDLRMLQKSLPQMNLCLASESCYLDLRDLYKRLKYMRSFTFPYKKGSCHGTNLSVLSQECLGKKLDKSNQLSNWSKRPLRRDQIIYAALDAYCLVQIYKVISECLTRKGYDIDQIVDQITSSHSIKPDKLVNKSIESSSTSRMPHKSASKTSIKSVNSADIKFSCDGMLNGLLHNLRRLGMDCLEINTRTRMDHCIRKAQQENRYVLSRDSRYMEFSKVLPRNLCIEIPEDAADHQVVNVIQLFNIAFNKNEIISRCPACNGDEFISASPQQLQVLQFGPDAQKNAHATQLASGTRQSRSNNITFVFKSNPMTEEVLQTRRTFSSAFIKVYKINPNIVTYFICDRCGRVTWPQEYRLSSIIENLILEG